MFRVYGSGCVQLACQLVSNWSPVKLACNRTLYQFLFGLYTMISPVIVSISFSS
jgi:hypothetical protein